MSRKKTLSETAAQILREAAVDHLQQDARSNQEPIHMGVQPSSFAGGYNDPLAKQEVLGGSTTEDPSGGAPGQLASKYAAMRGQADQPQHAKTGKAISPQDPMQQGPFPTSNMGWQMGPETPDMVQAEVNPPMMTPNGQAPLQTPGATEYVPVDPLGEEVELTAEEIQQIKAQRRASAIEYMQQFGVSEDIGAMFNGVSVTEDFKAKVATIFEAAVINRAVAVAEKLEEEILQAAEESVQEIKEELESQIDGYMNHIVETWMVDNQVAIESGLKTEIVEGFIHGLKDLFVEHYIEVPDEQVNVVEAMAAEVESLKDKLNETLHSNIELNKRLNEGAKFGVLAKVCEGLTTVQTEKLQTLAEGVEFTSESDYGNKLAILRDAHFSKVNKALVNSNQMVLAESAEPTAVEVQPSIDPVMSGYMNAMRRILK